MAPGACFLAESDGGRGRDKAEAFVTSVVYPEHGLSNIALAWMMEKAKGAGLRLRPGWRNNLVENPTGVLHESREMGWKLWPPAQREIPGGAKIHLSVQQRMSAEYYAPPLPKNHDWV
jgi:hypothetical protein